MWMVPNALYYSKKQPKKATFLTKHFVLTIFFIFGNLGIPSVQDPLSLDNASITSTDSGHVSTILFFRENDVFFTHFFVYFSSTFFAHFR